MRCIAVIPARGGSKRIPRKNIKAFLGKPIIAYGIEAALASGAQYISTDYYKAREEWSAYRAKLPGNIITRCNPVRTEQNCERK